MFAFGQTIFLFGLAAIAAPLVIHLLFRHRLTEMPFPTLRFLRMIDRRIMRRRRLEEMLLLALRMLLIAAFVMAMARPVFKSSVFAAGGHASVVIVIDDSMSMRAIRGGKSAFDDAAAAAREILATLKPQDEAAIVTASATSPIGPAFSTDLERIRTALRDLRPSFARADLSGAVAQARALLDRAANPMRELYILSDMQSLAWPPQVAAALAQIPRAVPVTILALAGGDEPNLTLSALTFPPSQAGASGPLRVEALVRNHSTATARSTLTLKVGGEPAASCPVEVGPSAAMTYSLAINPSSQAGDLLLEACLGPDALDGDNSFFIPLGFIDRIKVLLINGAPSPVPYLDECFYLDAALRSVSLQGVGRIETVKVSAAEAEGMRSFSDYAAVFMANVGRPSPSMASALREYVNAGGGLFIFLGDQVNTAAYNMLLGPAEAEQTVLPAQLGITLSASEKKAGAPQDAFQIIGSVKTGHPIFSGYAHEVDFTRLRFYRHTALIIPQTGRSAVLMALAGGEPILVEKTAGSGRVLLYAGGVNAAWDNLPLKPVFLPLVLQSLRYLSSLSQERRCLTVGVASRICIARGAEDGPAIDAYTGEKITIEGPDGARLEAEGEKIDRAIYASLPALPAPGFYAATAPTGSRNIIARIAANVDTTESDLRRVDVQSILRAAPNVRIVQSGVKIADEARRRREGLPLWDALFLAAILIAAAECLVSNFVLKK